MQTETTQKSTLNQDFPGQRKDEKIVLDLRKHWFTLAWPTTKGSLFIVLALILPSIGKVGFYIFNSGPLAFLYLAWLVFWASYIAYEYLNWYRDRFLITNQRIINIDQRGLFARRVSELELERVQDVSHEITGVFATAINFGSVTIQSAGKEHLVITQVAKPAELQDVIVRLVKAATEQPPVTVDELVEFIKEHRA
ncbi:hypothetical protein A2V68_02580 [candidate division Kazan bacterium RBG_13_50_9]|uniref:YdbS-like PH domain-containing protein n=1 Tax=candidate division Kazan bacterium RBG_13_50_9 TaxID=1798535 RepID=A0A1F4NRU0_UNCK3|nr:MAG: hypothetical protein A2V68_02580 [candidate division Kazan bacterium RBG_13_50_9]